jgi:hypothetical protein
MTRRPRHRVEVVRLARRTPLARPLVELEPVVDVVVPPPAELVRRLAWGGHTASELSAAVRDVFREGSRCR